MKNSPIKNLPASVRQRLYNLARERMEDFQYVLTLYALERLLFRMGASPFKKRFVLKGAMLFQIWSPDVHRMTRDLDLLDADNHEAPRVVEAFRRILDLRVPDDGIAFDTRSLRWEPIREGALYHGVRIRVVATLEKARIPLQVDVGFGDVVSPAPRMTRYPTLLDQPPPRVLAYARETAVAEKLHAMVVHGMTNTRMKDYYDVWCLFRDHRFTRTKLLKAFQASFSRQRTAFPTDWPPALTQEYFADPRVSVQWNAFWMKTAIPGKPVPLKKVGSDIRRYLKPYLFLS